MCPSRVPRSPISFQQRKVMVGGYGTVRVINADTVEKRTGIFDSSSHLSSNFNEALLAMVFIKNGSPKDLVIRYDRVAVDVDTREFVIQMQRGRMTLNDYANSTSYEQRCRDIEWIMRDIVQALDALHSKHKLVHCDLKPENIVLVVRDDGRMEVRLIDFGSTRPISLDGDDWYGRLRRVLCTYEYCAPETLMTLCNPTDKCDAYSLGASMYYFLFKFFLLNIKVDNDLGLVGAHQNLMDYLAYKDYKVWTSANEQVPAPEYVLTILENLLHIDPKQRMTISQVAKELRERGPEDPSIRPTVQELGELSRHEAVSSPSSLARNKHLHAADPSYRKTSRQSGTSDPITLVEMRHAENIVQVMWLNAVQFTERRYAGSRPGTRPSQRDPDYPTAINVWRLATLLAARYMSQHAVTRLPTTVMQACMALAIASNDVDRSVKCDVETQIAVMHIIHDFDAYVTLVLEFRQTLAREAQSSVYAHGSSARQPISCHPRATRPVGVGIETIWLQLTQLIQRGGEDHAKRIKSEPCQSYQVSHVPKSATSSAVKVARHVSSPSNRAGAIPWSGARGKCGGPIVMCRTYVSEVSSSASSPMAITPGTSDMPSMSGMSCIHIQSADKLIRT